MLPSTFTFLLELEVDRYVHEAQALLLVPSQPTVTACPFSALREGTCRRLAGAALAEYLHFSPAPVLLPLLASPPECDVTASQPELGAGGLFMVPPGSGESGSGAALTHRPLACPPPLPGDVPRVLGWGQLPKVRPQGPSGRSALPLP